MKTILLGGVSFLFAASIWAGTVGDDFDDDSVDSAKRGPEITTGSGTFTESSQHVYYHNTAVIGPIP